MSIAPESEPAAGASPLEVRSSLRFPVVGLGASAGGLAALSTFFGAMPSDTGMAFVVVLHLSPEHGSHVGSILQRDTRMPVQQVTAPVPVEANRVYVIPPNKQLSMDDGHLRLADLPPRRGRHVSIDLFFRALARVHRERAVGIVLSGTGSDGAVGLLSLKEHGGVAIAQSPMDAEHDGMPQSAIATGVVDMVLPAVEIPQKLIDLWANARRIQLPDAEAVTPVAAQPATPAAADAAEAALRDIMVLLRTRTGHDFRHYKRATVLRRIERRLQISEQTSLPAYSDFLETHPEETGALLQDMLISVTSFFRDREAFESLEREIARQFFEGTNRPEHLRAWVAGCATGEEAYSLAMLLAEQAAALPQPPGFQVFASDIDDRAIGLGRAGSYPESIVVDVPPGRLRQFFVRDGGRYRVKNSLRERILFAPHNVLRDPPFSRLDIVCCRNLLIYLEREVQAHVLEMFHFAMNPGGLLFLGSSESIDMVPRLFTLVDKKNRLYRANPGPRAGRPIQLVNGSIPVPPPAAAQRPAEPAAPSFEALHGRLLEQYAPPSVLVDADGNIVHLTERAGRFLRWGGGVPSNNLLSAVLPEIRPELRTALFHARRSGQSVAARRLQFTHGGRPWLLDITVRPVREEYAGGELMLVLFDELEATLADDAAKAPGDKDSRTLELEAELQRLNLRLQESIGQSETSTEDLLASNEELQAINEELRSATEELETSKEELQSVNEELTTVNYELKAKVEETAKTNDDLNNLIGSTDIATLFVDRAMGIKRFTPAAARVFNIIASDIGRSLLDLTHRLDYEQLADDAGLAFDSLKTVEREVRSNTGQYFMVRVLPYRTNEDRIDGAVFNFIDVSERRAAEEALRSREAQMRLVAESTSDFAMITVDPQGLVTSWNNGARRMFGYTEAEILGQPLALIFTEEDRAHGMPQEEMRRSREFGRAEDERWHRRKDGSTFYCSGIMAPLDGGRRGHAKIARDLTRSKLAQRRADAVLDAEKDLRTQLESSNALKDEFLAIMSHELKNPLNLIQLNAELLARFPEVRGVPAVARAADTIRRTVRSQAKIIDDLLDLSRVNTGKLTLHVAPFDYRALLERIVEAVRSDAENKRIRVSLAVDDGDFHLSADLVRTEQIAWNLLSNAMKFTPEGGFIEVRLGRDGVCARLDVTDSGRGIDPAIGARVFDMFQQGDARTTRQHGGLGIGLALVKSLAELHGGRAEMFSSGLGQGARFSVWLPLRDVGALHPATVAGGARLSGLRVLAVDDAPETLDVFRELLGLEGANVTVAHSGAEALALAEAADFDLLLSDVAMPGMDGYQLIGALRGMPRHARLPAVAVTGFGRTQDEVHALEAGFNAHVSKPVDIDDLLAAVARFTPPEPAG